MASRQLDRTWSIDSETRRRGRVALGDTDGARTQRTIAAALPGARVPDRAPLDAVAKLIGGARNVVGVDTGLLHLAAALGVPSVAIFVGSKPHPHRPGRQRTACCSRRPRGAADSRRSHRGIAANG